jgi:hypothetical protein
METGPEGKDAAAGRMRASNADRERVVMVLQVAFAEGRLARDEFGSRIGGALTARTYEDLAALTADIPAKTAAAPRPPAAPAGVRRPLGRRTVTGAWTLVTLAVMVTDAALTGNAAGPTAGLSLLFVVAFVVAFVSWLYAVSVHRGTAAAGPPPAGPPPAGRPRAGPASGARGAAASGRQPPQDDQADHGPAQAARGRPARRPQPVWRVGLASY